MNREGVAGVFAVIVALSLIGAPVTMDDWAEQATFEVDSVERSEVEEWMPRYQYENLSSEGRHAVRCAIESTDKSCTVYGDEDLPDEFGYSDQPTDYVIIYENQYYLLSTSWGGWFPVGFLLLELPFIAYGIALVRIAAGALRSEYTPRITLLATLIGLTFHLLGPELDFPIISAEAYFWLGVFAVGSLTTVVWTASKNDADSPVY
jgi:hypothetical protein